MTTQVAALARANQPHNVVLFIAFVIGALPLSGIFWLLRKIKI